MPQLRKYYYMSSPKLSYAAHVKPTTTNNNPPAFPTISDMTSTHGPDEWILDQQRTLLHGKDKMVEAISQLALPALSASSCPSLCSSMTGPSDTSRISGPVVKPWQHPRESRRPPKLWTPGQDKWFTEPLPEPAIIPSIPLADSRSKWCDITIMSKANKQLLKFKLNGKATCIASARMLAAITSPLLVPVTFLTTMLFFIIYFPGRLLSNIMAFFTSRKLFHNKQVQDSKLKTFKLDGRGRSKSNRNSSGCARCDLCCDCWYCTACAQCTSCRFCEDCTGCKGCEWCNGCVDCVDCVNCIGCVGLRGARGVTGGKA